MTGFQPLERESCAEPHTAPHGGSRTARSPGSRPRKVKATEGQGHKKAQARPEQREETSVAGGLRLSHTQVEVWGTNQKGPNKQELGGRWEREALITGRRWSRNRLPLTGTVCGAVRAGEGTPLPGQHFTGADNTPGPPRRRGRRRENWGQRPNIHLHSLARF